MSVYLASIEKLINRLCKLPGIGRRSAERIVSYILSEPKEEVRLLAEALWKVKESVKFCRNCNNLSEEEYCRICRDDARLKDILCIVEEPQDVLALEKSGNYRGLYYVLLGVISPLDGKGPSDLKIEGLMQKLGDGKIKEVIIATDFDTEGETTALYLAKLIKPLGLKITRIGVGIPMGSNVEYADTLTLSRALDSRREI